MKIRNRRRHKVIFRSKDTGKKLFVVKFTKAEIALIERAAAVTGETTEEFFISVIENVANVTFRRRDEVQFSQEV